MIEMSSSDVDGCAHHASGRLHGRGMQGASGKKKNVTSWPRARMNSLNGSALRPKLRTDFLSSIVF
jgi:hypothetical protein